MPWRVKRAACLGLVACVLVVFAWLRAAPGNAAVPVTQTASGQASGGGSVNIQQLVVVFSLRAQSGSGAAGDQSQYAVHQSAQAVVTDGASATIQQDIVDATIAEALTSGSGNAVGVSDLDNIDQEANVHASGPINISVNQLAGLLDVGAAAAGDNSSAVGASGSQKVTQVVVWRGTHDAELGQRAISSNVGEATDGTVNWDRQENLTADEASALIDQARTATASLLATQGVDANVQPDWISSLQIDRTDVVQQPSAGVTIHQSVAVVVVQLSTAAVEQIRHDTQTPEASLVDALPVAAPAGPTDDGGKSSSAAVVGSHADSTQCQEIGAPDRCPPPTDPPADDPAATTPTTAQPPPSASSDPPASSVSAGGPATNTAVEAFAADPTAGGAGAAGGTSATAATPAAAATPATGATAPAPVVAASSEAALPRSGVDAGSEVLVGVALMMAGLVLTGTAKQRSQVPYQPRHLAPASRPLPAGRHYARPPARHAHTAGDRR